MLAAPARVALRGAGADRPGPAAVAVEHHPDVLGQLVLGQRVQHARLVRGVQEASDAFLPLTHGADANFNEMNEAVRSARESIAQAIDQAVGETVAEIKPRLRGLAAPRLRAAHARGRHRAHRALADGLDPHRLERVRRLGAAASSPSRRSTTAVAGHRGRTASSSASTTPTSSCSSPAPTRRSRCCCSRAPSARSCSRVIWSVAVLGVLFKVFWIGSPALALPADLHRHGLGGGVLHPRLRRGLARPARRRHRHRRPGARDRAAARSTRSAASSTASSGPTRGRAGSASTRSSTPSRSWRS